MTSIVLIFFIFSLFMLVFCMIDDNDGHPFPTWLRLVFCIIWIIISGIVGNEYVYLILKEISK